MRGKHDTMGSMAAGAVTGAIFKSTGSPWSISADICSHFSFITSWYQAGHCSRDSNIRYGRNLELCEKKRLMFVYITLKFPLSWLSHLGRSVRLPKKMYEIWLFVFFPDIWRMMNWYSTHSLTYFQNFRWIFASFRFHVSSFGSRPSREYYKCSCSWLTPSHFAKHRFVQLVCQKVMIIIMAQWIHSKRFCSAGECPPRRTFFRHDEKHACRRPGDSSGCNTMNSNETRKMGCLRHRKSKVGGLLHRPSSQFSPWERWLSDK